MENILISAAEARVLASNEQTSHKGFTALCDKINSEANKGCLRTIFEEVTDWELKDIHLEMLRDLGYSISWNSPCQWYEVSWEE